MGETLRDDAEMHRLWYDLRTQSLFEPSFKRDVDEIDRSLERMIWRIVSEHAALSGAEPLLPSALTYGLFDGLFQQALRKHLQGDAGAVRALARDVERALEEMTREPREVRRARAKPKAPKRTRRPSPIGMRAAR